MIDWTHPTDEDWEARDIGRQEGYDASKDDLATFVEEVARLNAEVAGQRKQISRLHDDITKERQHHDDRDHHDTDGTAS